MIAPLFLLFVPPLIQGFVCHESFLRPIRLQKSVPTKLHTSSASPRVKTTASDGGSNPQYRQHNSTLAPNSKQLQQYQSEAAPIASSFQPTTFQPVPLLSNCHIQTMAGFFLRNTNECAYFRDVPSLFKGLANSILGMQNTVKQDDSAWYYDERERVVTPSGGAFFSVDHKYASATASPPRGTVIIVHGLESNSNSTLCIDMSEAFHRRNYDVAVINFRGCCGTNVSALYEDGTLVKNGENSLIYHLGFVDDLIYYLSLLAERARDNENKRIFLSGFSLGANVILKALGQMGASAVDKYGIVGAAVAGAPFDLEQNYKQFHNDPISRLVYVNSLLRKLKQKAHEILTVQYDGDISAAGFDYLSSIEATTIYEIENACVAPLFGFYNFLDYYRKTSCGYYLERICVPTYIVNARDDPFINSLFVPWDKVYGQESGQDVDGGGAPIKIVMTENGGHLGYIFHQVDSEWKGVKASWISEELASFVDHTNTKIHLKKEATNVVTGMPIL
ncbi:hypothetical protein HJC23_000484 [Cyclotella cryptica]|uniref:Serine aminopeptidase S33 domain-containing protein n=1 Tax=Cyclotella cryptica TaxID=29204 RepID=A0ABD3QBT9_9STRA|eukprot:CCRYP_007237-RA/>CCRYP_007237-RA protein AED:0.11 eAED:0.11 QI:0/-1/0/1/-1/1/1/0/504